MNGVETFDWMKSRLKGEKKLILKKGRRKRKNRREEKKDKMVTKSESEELGPPRLNGRFKRNLSVEERLGRGGT